MLLFLIRQILWMISYWSLGTDLSGAFLRGGHYSEIQPLEEERCAEGCRCEQIVSL